MKVEGHLATLLTRETSGCSYLCAQDTLGIARRWVVFSHVMAGFLSVRSYNIGCYYRYEHNASFLQTFLSEEPEWDNEVFTAETRGVFNFRLFFCTYFRD